MLSVNYSGISECVPTSCLSSSQFLSSLLIIFSHLSVIDEILLFQICDYNAAYDWAKNLSCWSLVATYHCGSNFPFVITFEMYDFTRVNHLTCEMLISHWSNFLRQDPVWLQRRLQLKF